MTAATGVTGRIAELLGEPRGALRRLAYCLLAGFVGCLVIGPQEGGSSGDFGIAFHEATGIARVAAFLALGVAIFVFITLWPLLRPYVRRPGAIGVGIGFLFVLAAMVLMNWYDPVGKFGALAKQVNVSGGVPFFANLFFTAWVAWGLMVLGLVGGIVVLIVRVPAVAYAYAAFGVLCAVICYVGHVQLVSFAGGIDHSLGVYVAVVGYLTLAGAGVVIARSGAEFAAPMAAVDRALSWRPGLPMAGAAIVLGVLALVSASWFSPLQANWDLAQTHAQFEGSGVAPLALNYLGWLGGTLLAVLAVLSLVACWLRSRLLGLATLVLGLVSVVLTLATLYETSKTAAAIAPQYGLRWANLGAGGWVMCLAFSMFAGAGALAMYAIRLKAYNQAETAASAEGLDTLGGGVPGDPAVGGQDAGYVAPRRVMRGSKSSVLMRTLLPFLIAFALFYPPTLTVYWQNVVVTQIAVYLLLAVGLNVVVGWAGLLDLGYIAFYGIGSYTTAYVTGSLPLKPPSWLQLSPLWAIPVAVVACLFAGVLLGAPTLRLRGDYLAIVTLGFGEIIQTTANNNPGNLTGGPIGPNVPHPVLNLDFLKVTWGLDNLPYWYLLLVLLGIVVLAFIRLERSRLGRAWAAIREDEVAAQASGVRITRTKLLAFAIGASTSGIAGVFFGSQVGYFDPTQFGIVSSILIVAYVVFGGMGSLAGALAGAAVLTWLPQFLKQEVPLNDSQMWIGGLVLAMMIFRPAGLIPAKRRAAELTGFDDEPSSEVRAVPVGEGLA